MPHSFSEWNPDEEVAKAAQMLYHDIENLELYVRVEQCAAVSTY